MSKLCFLLIIATLSLFPHISNAEYCPSTTILFYPKGRTCEFFGASKEWLSDQCRMDICGDGRILSEGHYCGKGPCNFLGFNCDGGCKSGNAIENFKLHNGNIISDLFTP